MGMTITGHHRVRQGEVEVIALLDGEGPVPLEGFVEGVADDEVRSALRGAGLPDDAIPMTFCPLLVRLGGRTLLFDAGNGTGVYDELGHARARMAETGVAPGEVDAVFVTHMDPDHVLGLMDLKTDAPHFPQARIFVPAGELRKWGDPGLLASAPEFFHDDIRRIQRTLPVWPNVTFFEDGTDLWPGIMPWATPGHTPGHTSYRIETGAAPLWVLGDISFLPDLLLAHPDWSPEADDDKPQAVATRRTVMERMVAEGAVVQGYHYPFPSLGRIARDGEGYRFEAL